MGQTLHMRSFRQHRGYQPARVVDAAAARAGRVRHTSVSGSTLPPHRLGPARAEDEPSNVVALSPEAGSSTGEVERPVRVMVVEGQTLIRAGYRALLEA